ncbi:MULTISPECIES: ESPR-type extended signal peptide-containing protein [unclassified Burkholderia]|uniref:ESPR-type extended signal peptide-containing protein n=1 Tax=unclassified Burkholderia TaxID=2613784 RepID=UPI00158E9BEF|nr:MULTISPECIES: ESPR-type extended signal peptide-containing protein [unclassified Burkholderia]
MNKSFKSIWNEALRAWVAISENSASRGKPNQLKLVVSLIAGMIALSATGEVAHANSAVVDRAVATGQAMALGGEARITQNLKVKAGVGLASGGNTVGMGASYQW